MFVATVLVAGLVASLGGTPVRASDTSVFGPQQVKTAIATCDSGARYAGGGMINYGSAGGGGVAITAVVPAEDQQSVKVIARAPAGMVGSWSVTAYVMCESSVTPYRETGTGVGTAEASCSDTTQLFGLGFRIEGGVPRSITIDQDLETVRVAADSWLAQVTAFALCRPSGEMDRVRTTTASHSWPIVAPFSENDPQKAVYGVGATVTGPPRATLDAIVPGPDNGTTWARGTLFGVASKKAFADEGGTVMVEAAFGGTFH
ncbi:hypothetical protein AB0M54_17010 [Actinoplanes sp. NPDC051470]|uniref:hypothetical protein n=1 Tax=unclassified Actinoplanes TaxID=2626549 RepID=UPI003437B27D